MTDKSNRKAIGFVFFVALVIIVASAAYRWAPVPFGEVNLTMGSVASLLALIFVIALFVERAQEVVLTNWRAKGSEELDLKILGLERKLKRLETSHESDEDPESLYQELEAARLDKLQYRAQTRVLALRVGVVMGLMVSMAGVRTLGSFVAPEVLLAFGTVQLAIFHGVDVIITGGVIAGGSDGVHKMAELYRVFVETKAKEEKQKLSPLQE
ncbi:MAG: hypothetical protein MI867_24370 [Pseudomonadales bacterium]|nr:hypothetical protein [Pseudomonadales bacterium]